MRASLSTLLLCFLVGLKVSSTYALMVKKFRSQALQNKHKAEKSFSTFQLFGYIPPERDLEYKNVVPRSTATIDSINILDTYPLPKQGDIVSCEGKWKGDRIIGSIMSLRTSYFKNETTWIADVLPMKPGKAENIFVIERGSKALSVSIDNLIPLKYLYVRSENGYKLYRKENSSSYSIRAPSFRPVDKTTKIPQKFVNNATLEIGMQEYDNLKRRIQQFVFQFGLAASLPVALAFNIQIGFIYFLGVCFSVLYLYLLGKETDGIGLIYSKRENIEDSLLSKASKTRFLTPTILLSIIAGYNYLTDGNIIQPFQFVTKAQFLAAIAGFLTYRISLFVSEVVPDLKLEDVIGILPGSLAEGYRQLKEARSGIASKEKTSPKDVNVVFVTGPLAAGREVIVDDLFRRVSNENKSLRRWKAFTSDFQLAERFPTRYSYIDESTLNTLRQNNGIMYETYVDSSQVAWSRVGLDNNFTYLLEGPPELLDRLEKQEVLTCTNVWVTAQTKEQFSEGAKRLGQYKEDDLMDEAISSINYFKLNGDKFKYTLLSTWFDKEGTSETELERLVK